MSINNQPEAQPGFEPIPAVRRQAEQPVKQSRDRAQYVRQQRGHSWVMEWCILGIFTMWIRPIYLAVSPNHYFHI